MSKVPFPKIETITCPTCHGETVLETMIGLSLSGSQSWHTETCPTCNGWGKIEKPEESTDEE